MTQCFHRPPTLLSFSCLPVLGFGNHILLYFILPWFGSYILKYMGWSFISLNISVHMLVMKRKTESSELPIEFHLSSLPLAWDSCWSHIEHWITYPVGFFSGYRIMEQHFERVEVELEWTFSKTAKYGKHSYSFYISYVFKNVLKLLSASGARVSPSPSLFWYSVKLLSCFSTQRSGVQMHCTIASFHVPRSLLPRPSSELQFLCVRLPLKCHVLIHVKMWKITGQAFLNPLPSILCLTGIIKDDHRCLIFLIPDVESIALFSLCRRAGDLKAKLLWHSVPLN